MLSTSIIQTLTEYTQKMQHTVTFVVQAGEHPQHLALTNFLNELTSVGDRIVMDVRENAGLRSPLSFFLEVNGTSTGILFSGIPSGHEFNSLILATLHAGGINVSLDATITDQIKAIQSPLHFEVFVSLSCHNCLMSYKHCKNLPISTLISVVR